MNLEQMRARLAEISAKLEEVKPGDEGFSEEQQTEVNDLSAEADRLGAQIDTAEKAQSVKDRAAASAGRKTTSAAPAANPALNVTVSSRSDKFGGFNSAGEWIMAVKKAGQTGELDARFKAAMQEKVGEDGGFLVPEEISAAILKKMEGDESLMARANVTQVSGNALTLNIDENQPWTGGIQAYWVAEGQSITESKANFKQAHFRLQKVAALVKATDELLEDATALASYITNNAPGAIMHVVNKAILNGNGAGKPQGLIQSPFTVTVAKESMQAADTILAENVLKMYSRMFPGSRASAAWFIHPQVEEQLRLLKDGNGAYIYLAPGGQMNQTPYGSLLGRPVIPLMGGMPALGDLGDILFADLSYYYMIRKASGVKSATSIHLNFDKEITSFRFSLRLDGKCPFQAPVTTENGSYKMSAFVQLEAR
jgi:HK97 family phage major capsid protein